MVILHPGDCRSASRPSCCFDDFVPAGQRRGGRWGSPASLIASEISGANPQWKARLRKVGQPLVSTTPLAAAGFAVSRGRVVAEVTSAWEAKGGNLDGGRWRIKGELR